MCRVIHQFTSMAAHVIVVKAKASKMTHDLLLLFLTVDNPREGCSKCNHKDDKTGNKTTIGFGNFRTDRGSFFGSSAALETSGKITNIKFDSSTIWQVDDFSTPVAVGISLAFSFGSGRAGLANTLVGGGTKFAFIVGTSGAIGGIVGGALVGLARTIPVAARIGITEGGGAVATDLGAARRSTSVVPVATRRSTLSAVGDVEAGFGVALVVEPHAVGVEEAGVLSLVTTEARLAGGADKSTFGVGQAGFGVGVLAAANSSADASRSEGARFSAFSGGEGGAASGVDVALAGVDVIVAVGRVHAGSLVARVSVAGRNTTCTSRHVPRASLVGLAVFLGGVGTAGGGEATSEGDGGDTLLSNSGVRAAADGDCGELAGRGLSRPGTVRFHHGVARAAWFVNTPVRVATLVVASGGGADIEDKGVSERRPSPGSLDATKDVVTNTTKPSVVLLEEKTLKNILISSTCDGRKSASRRGGRARLVSLAVRNSDGRGDSQDRSH